MTDELSATQEQLARFGEQIYKAVQTLGGDMEVLSVCGSLGDTMPIDDLTGMLKLWNETGCSFSKELSTDPDEIAEALTNPDAKARLIRSGFDVIPGGADPDKEASET